MSSTLLYSPGRGRVHADTSQIHMSDSLVSFGRITMAADTTESGE